MLDLFSIFSKGGLVLVWYIQNGAQTVSTSVNALVKSIALDDKVTRSTFNQDRLSLQYHMDTQFSLVYVVAYQSVLELSYMDKFLTEIALQFRDKYKNDLENGMFMRDFSEFNMTVDETFNRVKAASLIKPKKEMMTYFDSYKSSKTVKSMISDDKKSKLDKNNKSCKKNDNIIKIPEPETNEEKATTVTEELIQEKIAKRMKIKGKKPIKNGITKKKPSPTESPLTETVKKSKEKTKWNKAATGAEAEALNYSKKIANTNINGGSNHVNAFNELKIEDKLSKDDLNDLNKLKGQLQGELADIDTVLTDNEEDVSEDDEETYNDNDKLSNTTQKNNRAGGLFSALRSWVGVPGGELTQEKMAPILDKLKQHLIGKNVASEVADQICVSVNQSLMGQSLGTFERVSSRVKQVLEDSCRRLLRCGGRKADVLRDVVEAKRHNRPYVITFCGVNGVGKSTNLAKISFWLIEQGYRVLIAACDTFRSGAVEQLRVHVQKLNYIHPPEQHHGLTMAYLYEQGYGKDAAAVALSAINAARENHYDVVMIDTAGRMQDNEPLMRSLAKLINVNQPDLVLFVGEALVGHEAVDQLNKFNKALQDYSQSDKPRTLNGIVLTKFDTIDDKVGAAISMTYILGQPIMFVGTGQTYADLRQLSPEAVVKSLMK